MLSSGIIEIENTNSKRFYAVFRSFDNYARFPRVGHFGIAAFFQLLVVSRDFHYRDWRVPFEI